MDAPGTVSSLQVPGECLEVVQIVVSFPQLPEFRG